MQAIQNATAGDTIIVKYGNYSEIISVDRPLTLIGEDIDNMPILDRANISERCKDPIIYINSSGVNIVGLNISMQSGDSGLIGIHIKCNELSCDNINISYNRIYGYHRGILMENCFGTCNLSGNHIFIPSNAICAQTEKIGGGIGLIRCNDSTITSNVIEGYDPRGETTDGIYAKSSRDIVIYKNNFTNLKCGIFIDPTSSIKNDVCAPNNSFDRVDIPYPDYKTGLDLCRWR